ncbi:MAG: NUDIX hydrolase [Zetaproteobacteria bacterium]|nr:NUDIX hydrolase [Pseudobdellovibrionaceae bacterium]|tara:strand:+ start:158 stop:787 length:630 start_codon:yes stop_codon:yes gene_type:complete
MIDQYLSSTLKNYETKYLKRLQNMSAYDAKHEDKTIQSIKQFARENTEPYSRKCTVGHFTASSFLLNSNMTHTVLTHHKKLNLWLQLGGHADNCPFLHEVALKEAYEESGLSRIHFLRCNFLASESLNVPFDIDIHKIPENQSDMAHLHFDFRYLLISPENKLVKSDESHDIKWIEIHKIHEITNDQSILRMVKKFNYLKSQNFILHNK